jgi:putative heme-binding domain-containing protein
LALQAILTAKDAPLTQRQSAAAALAGSRSGTQWLLAANDKKDLPDDLKPEIGRLLRNSPHQDLRNQAMIAFPLAGKLDPKKLPAIPVLATRKGNTEKGQQILAASVNNEMQCLKCHTIRGIGGQVGPDLSMIGKKASRENLVESILLPSKAMANEYQTWVLETKNGLLLTGLIVEETADAVTLRDANGKDTQVAKKDIETRNKDPKSLMPENLVVTMTEDDLIDVVEYLATLKTSSVSFDSWHVLGAFDNGNDNEGLDKALPPETAIDLKATYSGRKGRIGWRQVKPNVQGYVDLQAFLAGDSDNALSYLYREVESAADQEAQVLIGTDDGAKLFVNGEPVYASRTQRAAVPGQDTVKVKLKKGKNPILLKINNSGGGSHGFYFLLLAEQEVKAAAR